VAVDATRSYGEQSLTWMNWYLGAVTLAAAIVGAGLLVRQLLLGRLLRALTPLLLIGPAALLYLWRPSAVPDQVWITRRFLVGTFPALILLALGFFAWVATTRRRGAFFTAARAAAYVAAVAAVAFPLYTIRNVSAMTEDRGYLSPLENACAAIGPKATVIVLERDKDDPFDDMLQALRGWCGATVASMIPPQSDVLRNLAREYAATGRKLFVAAGSPQTIEAVLPDANVHLTPPAINRQFLERTIERRPSKYEIPQAFGMAVAQVPVAPAG
jgi:hypothetical protein